MIHNFLIEPDQDIPQPRQDHVGASVTAETSTPAEKASLSLLEHFMRAMSVIEVEDEPSNLREEGEL